MAKWRIMIEITSEDTDAHPIQWDWNELLETPYPVEIQKVIPLDKSAEVTDKEFFNDMSAQHS